MAEEEKEIQKEEVETTEETPKVEGYWIIRKPNPKSVLKKLAKGLGIAAGGAAAGIILGSVLSKDTTEQAYDPDKPVEPTEVSD